LECPFDPSSKVLVLLLLCFIGVMVLMAMTRMAKHPTDTVGSPFKCFVDYLQMMASLSAFSVAWSSLSVTLLDVTSAADFGPSLASITCFHTLYANTLILSVLSPLIIFGLLALAIIAHRSCFPSKALLSDELKRGLGVTIFLSYATICKGSFEYFPCDTINGRRLLIADMDIDCDSPGHAQLLPWALLGLSIVIIVPITWIVFITWMSSHSTLRSSLMVISRRNVGKRGMLFRTLGSLYFNFTWPEKDDEVSLAASISAAWEGCRLLKRGTLFDSRVLTRLFDCANFVAIITRPSQMNLLTVVSPFRNYRAKLLELMSLTSVSMTLALGIVDEPDFSTQSDVVSIISVLIIVVNSVFFVCVLNETWAEILKKRRKKLRTREFWKIFQQRKDAVVRCMLQGMPSKPSDGRDSTTVSLGMPDLDVETHARSHDLTGHDTGACSNEEDMDSEGAIEMQDFKRLELETPQSDYQSEDDLVEAPLPSARQPAQNEEWEDGSRVLKEGASDVAMDNAGSRALNSRITDIVNLADKLISAASDGSDLEKNLPMPPEALTRDFEEEEILDPPSTAPPRARQMSLMITEDGDEYYLDNATNETMWDLPDGSILV
jgi:hypothetical protein